MDARILKLGINEDQPVAPKEIDGIINVNSAPSFFRKHPGMVCRLW